MNKLLINSLVTGIFMSAAVVYADDAHHPEQSGAAVVKSAPGKMVPADKKSTVHRKSLVHMGSCSITDEQMGKAQERMKQAQAIMVKIREAKDPAERQQLMQAHMQMMRDTMSMMDGMKMGMMGGGQEMGMGMKGQGKGQAKAGNPMHRDQMMEERMGMMQMMMEQMLERQEMLMQDGK